ncbi:MAG: GIY-YIG nuclease family protein, partial [Acidobacteriota bacterium]|nr:GIY-YIG nuclease family protein [Acidobacteriota bacterium]
FAALFHVGAVFRRRKTRRPIHGATVVSFSICVLSLYICFTKYKERFKLDNKKELKEKYKQMKPEMGVFMYKCLPSGKAYLGFGKNINAAINGISLQLSTGNYPPNKNLQEDWKKYGENGFEISVLEILEYDEDETKNDYTEDLRALRELLAEKFTDFEYIKK